MIDIELQGKAAIDWWYKEKDPAKLIQYLNPPNIAYSERKLRLFCVACCRRQWDKIQDQRLRNVVDKAEEICDNDYKNIDIISNRGLNARAEIKDPKLYRIALAFTHTLAINNRLSPINICYNLSSRPSTNKITNERAIQCDLLRDIIGNPIDIIDIDSSWLTPEVNNLVKCAFFDRLPDYNLNPEILGILSDALEEAGMAGTKCTKCGGNGYILLDDPSMSSRSTGFSYISKKVCIECDGKGITSHPIINHLRDNSKPHVRGCWVVDLLLGKK